MFEAADRSNRNCLDHFGQFLASQHAALHQRVCDGKHPCPAHWLEDQRFGLSRQPSDEFWKAVDLASADNQE
jgi:hypothetical protein